ELKKLSTRLNREKIHFYDFDRRGDNIGYLPVTTQDWPHGIPVVIDPGAVTWLNESTSAIKRALGHMRDRFTRTGPAAARQSEIFAGLRQHFAAAQASGFCDSGAMDLFWHECM